MQHPCSRGQIVVKKSLQNVSYSIHPVNEIGIFTFEDKDGKLVRIDDDELDLLSEFQRNFYERLYDGLATKIEDVTAPLIDYMYLRSNLYFEELQDFKLHKIKIFKVD